MRILVGYNGTRQPNSGLSRTMRFIHDQLVQNGDTVDYFCSEDVPRPWDGRIARFSFPLLLWRHAIRAARQGRPYDLINVHEPSAAAISTYRVPAGHPVVTVTTFGVEKRGWELSL